MLSYCKSLGVILAIAFVMSGSMSHTVFAGDIKISIERLKTLKGHVEVALYDSAEHFAKQETPLKRWYVPTVEIAQKGILAKNLPEGFYALAIYHDENNNRLLDQTFFAWPLEGFGFSLDVAPLFTLPDFKDTSFYLANNSRIRQGITMRYWGQFDFDRW